MAGLLFKQGTFMKLVSVTWLDAVSCDSWEPILDARNLKPARMVTIGFLLHEDDDKVVLSASYDEENQSVASTYAIPKSWVLSIKEIES